MSQIKLLDTHTINKIAAGEVVERPASVVKELTENCIDAKASSITVEIKNGGLDLIRVTDNGHGIPKEQVEMAFLRHATSKITSVNDLLEVTSLGFRGEALASIGAVAKVEIITKTPGMLTGKRVAVHGGKIDDSEEIACPDGTTLMVRQLFYNVPARKAFLKSISSETSKVADTMYKLALAHPEIAFKYIQNNKLVFATSGNRDLIQGAFQLYGKETAKNVTPFYEKIGDIEVAGLIGNASLSRGNRNYEHFFINGRAIKSALLQKATEEAYKTFITIGKFPFVIVHLTIDPEIVDVNVHPTKLEVRFKDSIAIFEGVSQAVRNALQKENHIPEIVQPIKNTLKPEPIPKEVATQLKVESFFTPHKPPEVFETKSLAKNEAVLAEPIKPRHVFETKPVALTPKPQEVISPKIPPKTPIETVIRPISASTYLHDKVVSDVQAVKETTTSELPVQQIQVKEHIDYKVIGQFFNTYWVIEYNEALFVIDQHSAHERVMYEQLMKDYSASTVSSQMLLVPETIPVSESQKTWLLEHLSFFTNLGFNIEGFGDNHIIIREVPYLFNKPMSIASVRAFIDSLEDTMTFDIYQFKEESIIQMACKKAIKAHDQLDEKECHALIESLLNLENPFTCPHGRPTIVSLKKTDIEKIFKRIQ